MKEYRATAQIVFDPKKGWVLPTFGSKKTNQFRYWAHVHFENDPMWGKQTWTLLIDLDKEPDLKAENFEALVYFMSPEAPQQLLEKGAKFELLCGENYYTQGFIKHVFEVEK